MNKSPLTTILLTVGVISALASVFLCWKFVTNSRELNALNGQLAGIQNNKNITQALLQETAAYREKNPNPALDSMIEAITGKKPANAPSSKPSTK